MALPLLTSDAEIDASASESATAVLEHPLARRLGLDARVLTAIADADPSALGLEFRP